MSGPDFYSAQLQERTVPVRWQQQILSMAQRHCYNTNNMNNVLINWKVAIISLLLLFCSFSHHFVNLQSKSSPVRTISALLLCLLLVGTCWELLLLCTFHTLFYFMRHHMWGITHSWNEASPLQNPFWSQKTYKLAERGWESEICESSCTKISQICVETNKKKIYVVLFLATRWNHLPEIFCREACIQNIKHHFSEHKKIIPEKKRN